METENLEAQSLKNLVDAGFEVRLCGFSAIDCYFRLPHLPYTWIETNADLAELSRLFEGLRFPGTDTADAALDIDTLIETSRAGVSKTLYFRCLDPDEPKTPSFYFDWKTSHFHDPDNIYPVLREIRKGFKEGADYCHLETFYLPNLHIQNFFEIALFLSRYPVQIPLSEPPSIKNPSIEQQRTCLVSMLLSPRPDLGLEFLKKHGVVTKIWKELARLDDVEHSKDFHPEGNGWRHTLETFRYRKNCDLLLSLALLLHDTGKPLSISSGGHRFEKHAELGVSVARNFLKHLDFAPSLIEDVCFLVRNHMFPAALPHLPLSSYQTILDSPLFPTLMDLYYCDESSSFKGLDHYHTSSAVYQAYLRRRRKQ
jgi:poly(A) polymerase